MITIDSSGASANVSDEVFLPPVLQDRKSRTIGGNSSGTSLGGGGGGASTADGGSGTVKSHQDRAGMQTTALAEVNPVQVAQRPEVVQLATPSSTLPKLAKGVSGFTGRTEPSERAPSKILNRLRGHP